MKFEFSRHTQPVEIEGEAYELDCSTAAQAYICEKNAENRRLIERIKRGESSPDEAVSLMKDVFERILGAGSVERIFRERTCTVDDLTDLALFVRDAYRAYNSEYQKRLEG